MTVQLETNKVTYSCDGVLTTFPFTFKVFQTSDIKVILVTVATGDEEVLTETTDYAVTGSLESGGRVTTVSTYSSDYKLLIALDMTVEQQTDLIYGGTYSSEAIEEMSDKLTKIAQQHDEEIDRALKFKASSSDKNIEVEDLEADKTITVNAAGDGLKMGPSTTEISNAQTYAENALAAQVGAEAADNAAEVAQAAAELAETHAETAETNAVTAKNAAETAQTAAELAETGAQTAQGAAETAQSAAETAETNAETAQTAAELAETHAAASESAASTSETNAANSESAAATSEANAAASYDSFDDRYLGAKTSDPSLDNDGDALITGALYFNTITNRMRVYSGTWANLEGAKAGVNDDITSMTGLDNYGIPNVKIDNSVVSKTTTATLTVAEAGLVLVSASSPYTITLPTAVGNAGLTYHFKKTDANYNLITLDGNGTETFNYENADGVPKETYARLNTYCAEVTVVSDGSNWQVIDEALGQVPECYVYQDSDQTISTSAWIYTVLNNEIIDVGSNFDTSVMISGTATATTAGHLIDTTNNPFTAAMVGYRVKNTTDTTYTTIISYNSSSDVSLADDIFVSGEGYEIKNAKFVTPINGTYLIINSVAFYSNTQVDKLYSSGIKKNNTTYIATPQQYCGENGKDTKPPIATIMQSLLTGDIIKSIIRNDGTADVTTRASMDNTWMQVKLIAKD